MSESSMPGRQSATLASLVAEVTSGGTPTSGSPRYYQQSGIPFVKIDDMTKSTDRFIDSTALRITPAAIRESAARILPTDTILISMYGTIGLTKVLNKPMASNQAIAALIPPFKCDPAYLYHAINSCRHRFEQAASQTTQPNISGKIIKEFEIHVPIESREQRKIAEILDTVDESIRSTERLIAKLSNTKVGILTSLTSGTDDQFLRPLDCCVTRIEAGKSPDAPDRPAGNEEWGVLKVSAVRAWGLDEAENKVLTHPANVNPRYEVRAGDLLITRANTPELVGLACYVGTTRPRLLLSDKTLRLIVNYEVANPQYLSHILSSHDARRQIETCGTGSSGSMKNISQREIRSIRIPLPDIIEQDRIVEIVGSSERAVARERNELAKLRMVKQGLMEDLLTGRVRVKVD